MESIPPMINTARLKPFRQRMHRTVMSITDTGCVTMEIMGRHANQPNNQEIVKELFRVSPDGKNVEVYQNPDGLSVQDGCPLPGQTFKLYTYPELPSKHLKKYQHAFKFVELVKSRTAKVVLVTETAQCKLMENSHPADFKADFFNGSSVVLSKSSVTVTDQAGATLTFDSQSVSQYINPDMFCLVQSAQLHHQKCLDIEGYANHILLSGVNKEMFPVTVGSSKTPYRISSGCENEPIPDTIQPNGDIPELEQPERVSSQAGDANCHVTGLRWTSSSAQGTPGQSLCSEAELCKLLDGQLSEFGGSSRASSLITGSRSRSDTPQTQSSASLYEEGWENSLPVIHQQFPSDPTMCIEQPQLSEDFKNFSAASYEQCYTHLPNASSFTVPSSRPQSLELNERNISSSTGFNVSLVTHEHVYSLPQTGPVDSMDRSLPSNVQEFSTPNKNSECHQQLPISNHFHSSSKTEPNVDYRQPHDLKAQMLLEHRHNLVTGHLQAEKGVFGVRRALDLDLSLPISSPVPISGTHGLQQDLLAIQPTPSLDLSDCSEGPDPGTQHEQAEEEDQFLKFPNFQHPHQSGLEWKNRNLHHLRQSASDNLLQEVNSSLSVPSDIVGSNLRATQVCAGQESSVLAMPGARNKPFEQTVLSNESISADGTLSSQFNISHSASSIQTTSGDVPGISLPVPHKMSSSYQASNQGVPSNPPLTLKSSISPETLKQGVPRPQLHLGLHSSHTKSNINTQATGCCSSNCSNNSSNTSSSLDQLSPQSSLPSHLRHSLDMSVSSHYSDSSAPSSSCAGDVVRQLFVPYTGWASLHATGAVWVLYNDGTQLGVKSTQPAMIYVDQDSTEISYSNCDTVPEIVRLKLEKLPSIVEQLMRAPVSAPPAQLLRPRPGGTHKP